MRFAFEELVDETRWRAHEVSGVGQSGGVFEWPAVPELGYDTWAEMSGMQPGHPLVGGVAGTPGYGGGQRQVAIAQANPTAGVASGAPARSHWSELFNFKGNPIGWVLLMALGYYALNHIHFRASVGAKAGVRK